MQGLIYDINVYISLDPTCISKFQHFDESNLYIYMINYLDISWDGINAGIPYFIILF